MGCPVGEIEFGGFSPSTMKSVEKMFRLIAGNSYLGLAGNSRTLSRGKTRVFLYLSLNFDAEIKVVHQ